MLTMLSSPTLLKKLLTTSSNLSWPTSTQSVCRMVLVRIFLSASLANSSGASGFSIKLSVGNLRTGTFRCISIFAAADEAMGLMGLASTRGAWAASGTALGTGDAGMGITMASPQEGQLISVPAPELSTASSWSHLGQLKTTSIRGLWFQGCDGRIASV